MFKFWGSQEETSQPRPLNVSTQSWYPTSVVGSSSLSHPTTPTSSTSSYISLQNTSEKPQSPSHVSPAEAAGIISALKDKRLSEYQDSINTHDGKHLMVPQNGDELRKLLHDNDAYHQFLLSLDQVKTQNNVKDELRKETLLLARENLEKEPRIVELRNQCRIIRTSELAAAQEKLNELERQKYEILKFYSPPSLLRRLQETMNNADEESENLHQQLLDKDIDLASFVQKYKKLRVNFHKRALVLLAAKMSSDLMN